MILRTSGLAALTLALACASTPDTSSSGTARASEPHASSSGSTAVRHPARTLSIVGTNDLHGRVHALPILSGYVDNLRAARKADDGSVLLLDAGDIVQGTLESNLLEGIPVRDAYAKLGYTAVAIGNHEFDFGPVGPDATPRKPSDDRRGALFALSKDAPFPFLAANILDQKTGKRVDWPNVVPHVVVDAAGTKVGIIGVTTEETLRTTISSNVDDLAMMPMLAAIQEQVKLVREKGATVVVVSAHAGGKCKRYTNDVAADECETHAEIFELARALPKGSVDVIVAGHSHAGVAHEVNGIAIIEQLAYGVAFGRVDLTIGEAGAVVGKKIFAPQTLCGDAKGNLETCDLGTYEGANVTRSSEISAILKPAIDQSSARRKEEIGPTLTQEVRRSYDEESALGNLFADLMLAQAKGADVAFMNGGGLRTNLPAGKLTYGALFESFPFDNRLATATVTVGELERIIATNLTRSGGILSLAGVQVSAACKAGALEVTIVKPPSKKPLADDVKLKIVGSDFMFLGGDGFWGDVKDKPIEVANELMRDAMELELKKRPTVDPAKLFDAKNPRMRLPGPRPLSCAKP